MLLSYDKIFSRVLGKITDYKLQSLSEQDLLELEVEWLHSAMSNVRIRNLFSSLSVDDELLKLEYQLKYSVDEFSDNEFVIDLLSLGMVIAWLRPQVDSVLYTAPLIGGKEEKKVLDTHKDTINRLDSLEIELKKMIRDHGYIHNSYIKGE